MKEVAASKWFEAGRHTILVTMYERAGEAIISPPRLVDGHDVMRLLRMRPGVEVGRLLDEVRQRQVAGEISSRREALELLTSLAEQLGRQQF